MDKLYSFIMRGELTKVALEKTDVISNLVKGSLYTLVL